MKTFIRFGRRIPIPSTTQIRHELRAFCGTEDLREECAAKLGLRSESTWDEIGARHAAVAK